jgi:hypothetical protein
LKEIRRAHRCFEALVSGQVGSVAELATLEEISDRYVSSLLPLAFLAPFPRVSRILAVLPEGDTQYGAARLKQ